MQAQALEPIAAVPGSGSVTAILLSSTTEQPPGPQAKRQEMWMQALHGMADQSITLDAEAGLEGRWPPVKLDKVTATLKFQSPVLARVVQQLGRLMHESAEATDRAGFGEELGISTETDVEEVIEWGLKAKLLFAQHRDEFIPTHAQVLSFFALSQPRLLAGIPPHDIHNWDDFLMLEANAHPEMLNKLRDEVYVSACKQPCTHPGVGTGEWGLSVELEKELTDFVDKTHDKYLFQ
jgi:hypothetical protein